MYRLIRTRRLGELREAEAAGQVGAAEAQRIGELLKAERWRAEQAEMAGQRLQRELAAAGAAAFEADVRAHTELQAARAQVLLDAEDRVALRALLRTARRQAARADRVYLLYRKGQLHSIHTSVAAAEEVAEAEGASPTGWVASSAAASTTPGEDEPDWLIRPQRVAA